MEDSCLARCEYRHNRPATEPTSSHSSRFATVARPENHSDLRIGKGGVGKGVSDLFIFRILNVNQSLAPFPARLIRDESGLYSAGDLIEALAPKIRGWALYHRHALSKRT